jgi:hypothetical protein
MGSAGYQEPVQGLSCQAPAYPTHHPITTLIVRRHGGRRAGGLTGLDAVATRGRACPSSSPSWAPTLQPRPAAQRCRRLNALVASDRDDEALACIEHRAWLATAPRRRGAAAAASLDGLLATESDEAEQRPGERMRRCRIARGAGACARRRPCARSGRVRSASTDDRSRSLPAVIARERTSSSVTTAGRPVRVSNAEIRRRSLAPRREE